MNLSQEEVQRLREKFTAEFMGKPYQLPKPFPLLPEGEPLEPDDAGREE